MAESRDSSVEVLILLFFCSFFFFFFYFFNNLFLITFFSLLLFILMLLFFPYTYCFTCDKYLPDEKLWSGGFLKSSQAVYHKIFFLIIERSSESIWLTHLIGRDALNFNQNKKISHQKTRSVWNTQNIAFAVRFISQKL